VTPIGTTDPLHRPALEQAKRVSAWILRNLRSFQGDRRGTAPLAMHDQVIEHHVGLVILAEQRIFGSAIALLRPMIECYLRGLWLERMTAPAIDRFLASDEPPDADAMVRVLRKAGRLRDAEPVLAAWERSPLHRHPFLSSERMMATPRVGELDSRFVPGLDEVIDALDLGTAIALLATMKVATIGGNPGVVQAARFRLALIQPGHGIGS
jgi:hypothetical protein